MHLILIGTIAAEIAALVEKIENCEVIIAEEHEKRRETPINNTNIIMEYSYHYGDIYVEKALYLKIKSLNNENKLKLKHEKISNNKHSISPIVRRSFLQRRHVPTNRGK